ncbi:MAG: hypothetical protein LZF60_50201 [Nitrospira sp.]|nr:MAG: hypothetical protein LZF60_50201 [Nitrospira sp.]
MIMLNVSRVMAESFHIVRPLEARRVGRIRRRLRIETQAFILLYERPSLREHHGTNALHSMAMGLRAPTNPA